MKCVHIVRIIERDEAFRAQLSQMLCSSLGFTLIDDFSPNVVLARPWGESQLEVDSINSSLDGLHGIQFTSIDQDLLRSGKLPIELCDRGKVTPKDYGQPSAPRSEVPEEISAWLSAYSGNFPFYVSLKAQLASRGDLSPKQIEAVRRAIERDTPKPPVTPSPSAMQIVVVTPNKLAVEFSIAPGDILEVRQWMAKKIGAEFGFPIVFRNLEVVEVLRETDRAWQVKIKFSAKVCVNCHICGRALDKDISRATGIGPICAMKLGISRNSENVAEILAALVKTASEIGTVGPLWIAKSQVVQVIPVSTDENQIRRQS